MLSSSKDRIRPSPHRWPTERSLLGSIPLQGAKILYKVRAPAKYKFFTWLSLHDRCWTANRRKRHNLQYDDSCIRCSQLCETIDHLLVGCSFLRELWLIKIFLKLGWHLYAPGIDLISLVDWWSDARKKVPKSDRKYFDSLVILVCWLLWKERNRRTFDWKERTIEELLSLVADEVVY